jgi:hypothetical protein
MSKIENYSDRYKKQMLDLLEIFYFTHELDDDKILLDLLVEIYNRDYYDIKFGNYMTFLSISITLFRTVFEGIPSFVSTIYMENQNDPLYNTILVHFSKCCITTFRLCRMLVEEKVSNKADIDFSLKCDYLNHYLTGYSFNIYKYFIKNSRSSTYLKYLNYVCKSFYNIDKLVENFPSIMDRTIIFGELYVYVLDTESDSLIRLRNGYENLMDFYINFACEKLVSEVKYIKDEKMRECDNNRSILDLCSYITDNVHRRILRLHDGKVYNIYYDHLTIVRSENIIDLIDNDYFTKVYTFLRKNAVTPDMDAWVSCYMFNHMWMIRDKLIRSNDDDLHYLENIIMYNGCMEIMNENLDELLDNLTSPNNTQQLLKRWRELPHSDDTKIIETYERFDKKISEARIKFRVREENHNNFWFYITYNNELINRNYKITKICGYATFTHKRHWSVNDWGYFITDDICFPDVCDFIMMEINNSLYEFITICYRLCSLYDQSSKAKYLHYLTFLIYIIGFYEEVGICDAIVSFYNINSHTSISELYEVISIEMITNLKIELYDGQISSMNGVSDLITLNRLNKRIDNYAKRKVSLSEVLREYKNHNVVLRDIYEIIHDNINIHPIIKTVLYKNNWTIN